jgi:hypothetical protein
MSSLSLPTPVVYAILYHNQNLGVGNDISSPHIPFSGD